MLTITLNLNYSTNVRSKQLLFFNIAQKIHLELNYGLWKGTTYYLSLE
jgi:hypothetical protein